MVVFHKELPVILYTYSENRYVSNLDRYRRDQYNERNY